MTPDERRLIEDLFERLSAQRAQGMDRQAEALIHDLVRDVPDAAYMLVQTVLVYEHQLREAAGRIQALQAERDDRTSSDAAGGSFLPDHFGTGQGGRPAAVRSSFEYRKEATSVPRAGGSGVWVRQGPAAAPAAANAEPPRAGGGGFFRSAMATAAGVAGGMLAADGLRSLFGGSSAAADTQHNTADSAARQESTANQDATHEETSAHDDSDQGWGIDDLGIGDLDI